MKVKAAVSFVTSVAGVKNVASFEHGSEYDLPEAEAQRLADAGLVELLEKPKPKPAASPDAEVPTYPAPEKTAAPKSKRMGAAPENKTSDTPGSE